MDMPETMSQDKAGVALLSNNGEQSATNGHPLIEEGKYELLTRLFLEKVGGWTSGRKLNRSETMAVIRKAFGRFTQSARPFVRKGYLEIALLSDRGHATHYRAGPRMRPENEPVLAISEPSSSSFELAPALVEELKKEDALLERVEDKLESELARVGGRRLAIRTLLDLYE